MMWNPIIFFFSIKLLQMMREEEARCETLRNPEKYCIVSHVVNSLKVAKLTDITENWWLCQCWSDSRKSLTYFCGWVEVLRKRRALERCLSLPGHSSELTLLMGSATVHKWMIMWAYTRAQTIATKFWHSILCLTPKLRVQSPFMCRHQVLSAIYKSAMRRPW